MKKTLITIVLATFLVSMPVASEGRENSLRDELQTVSTSNTPAVIQSIGIGRRRSVRRRRRMIRRAIRRNRGRHLRRGVSMRRSVRGRRHPRTMGLRLRPRVPRGIGIGVGRGRRN